MKDQMNSRKKTFSIPIIIETPRTNDLLNKVQAEPIPFEVSFWELLELTRELELEVMRLERHSKRRSNRTV